MRLSTKLSSLLLPFLLISCGENTTTSPLPEITSIDINDSNISLYSTDTAKEFKAFVHYSDNTSADVTKDVTWSTPDTSMLVVQDGKLTALKNGGDTSLKIEYASLPSNSSKVHIKELLTLTYLNTTDINISDTSKAQTLNILGNFENNESNVSLVGNITWSGDENVTINEQNASSVTFTVLDANVTSIMLHTYLFKDTANQVDFPIDINKIN